MLLYINILDQALLDPELSWAASPQENKFSNQLSRLS